MVSSKRPVGIWRRIFFKNQRSVTFRWKLVTRSFLMRSFEWCRLKNCMVLTKCSNVVFNIFDFLIFAVFLQWFGDYSHSHTEIKIIRWIWSLYTYVWSFSQIWLHLHDEINKKSIIWTDRNYKSLINRYLGWTDLHETLDSCSLMNALLISLYNNAIFLIIDSWSITNQWLISDQSKPIG